MKHLFLFLMASTLVFTSCNKDDDNDSASNEEKIVGTWQFTSESLNGVEVPVEDCELLDFYTFNEDNTGLNTYNDCDDTNIENIDIFTYDVTGDRIEFSYEGNDIESYEISTLNGSTLSIKQSFEEQGVTLDVIVTFTKQ